MDAEAKARLKKRALEELRIFWMLVAYLWVFLGAFTVYRRLVVEETGSAYLNYGIAIIEALVIAKVILVGRMIGLSRRYERRPLYESILYKTVFFGGIVLLFGLVEHLVKGWLQGKGFWGGLATLDSLGTSELGARILMLMTALLPLFVFWEIGRLLGPDRVRAMVLARRDDPEEEKR